MTRFEFTKKLRKALSGRVNHVTVNENVAYYENYIDAEMKKGRKEKEILEELGDPRLIARTIIDTAQEGDLESVKEKDRGGSGGFFGGKIIRIPSWLFTIILIVVFIIVFKVIGLVLGLLLPVVIPVILICWLIRYFRRR